MNAEDVKNLWTESKYRVLAYSLFIGISKSQLNKTHQRMKRKEWPLSLFYFVQFVSNVSLIQHLHIIELSLAVFNANMHIKDTGCLYVTIFSIIWFPLFNTIINLSLISRIFFVRSSASSFHFTLLLFSQNLFANKNPFAPCHFDWGSINCR